MNISVPDRLYERLDRLRDRVNASKVCASALEKELDMIEARTAPTDPDIERLVQRLLSSRERWYERGREDGKRWAVSDATREQIWQAVDEMEGEDGEDLARQVRQRDKRIRRLFGGFDFMTALERWSRTDDGSTPKGAAATPMATRPDDKEDDDEDAFPPDFDPFKPGDAAVRIHPDVDLASYMEGWRDVLDEIWKAVSARLKR